VGDAGDGATRGHDDPDPTTRESAPIPSTLRRERMLLLIRNREYVRVRELGDHFGISDVTVRSDLDSLTARGQIHRVRGGAIPRLTPRQELPFEDNFANYADEKAAIGQVAAALIGDGETVLIDVGTTTTAAARALANRTELHDVVVFTNGLQTALALEPAIPRITVVVLGGTLRPLQHSLVDPLATVILREITVKTVFLGCSGVDTVGGVTNINLPEAEIKKQMLATAQRKIVLADGGKFGQIEVARLCPIEGIDTVITGRSADRSIVNALREQGCDVIVVE
jgi:DeoR family transcriptional regulator of aga operon